MKQQTRELLKYVRMKIDHILDEDWEIADWASVLMGIIYRTIEQEGTARCVNCSREVDYIEFAQNNGLCSYCQHALNLPSVSSDIDNLKMRLLEFLYDDAVGGENTESIIYYANKTIKYMDSDSLSIELIDRLFYILEANKVEYTIYDKFIRVLRKYLTTNKK